MMPVYLAHNDYNHHKAYVLHPRNIYMAPCHLKKCKICDSICLYYLLFRNISSAGYDARKKLRECRSLVNALIHALQQARDDNNIDCKPVENVVCILRNLSYRVQEMEDPDFYKKRSVPRSSAPPSKGEMHSKQD